MTSQRRPRAHRTQFQLQNADGGIVAVAQTQREADALMREAPDLRVVRSQELIEEAPSAQDVTTQLQSQRSQPVEQPQADIDEEPVSDLEAQQQQDQSESFDESVEALEQAMLDQVGEVEDEPLALEEDIAEEDVITEEPVVSEEIMDDSDTITAVDIAEEAIDLGDQPVAPAPQERIVQPPPNVEPSIVNAFRQEFGNAQSAVLRGVSEGDDLNNAQRLANLRAREFLQEFDLDVAGFRTRFDVKDRFYPRAIASAQSAIINLQSQDRRGRFIRGDHLTPEGRANAIAERQERIADIQRQQAENTQARRDFEQFARETRQALQETLNDTLRSIPQIVQGTSGEQISTSPTTAQIRETIEQSGGVDEAIASGALERSEAISIGVSDEDFTRVGTIQEDQFPAGTRFQLINQDGVPSGFASGQAAIDAAIDQGFTVQAVTVTPVAPTAAELREMPSDEAEAIRTAPGSGAQQVRAGIGPDFAPEDFEGGIDEPRQQLALRLQGAGVLDQANNTIDIPGAIDAGFTSEEIQQVTGLGPIAITAGRLEADEQQRLAAGRVPVAVTPGVVLAAAPVAQPTSLEFNRVIEDQQRIVNALAQVQGPIPAGFEFESQKIDALEEVRDAVSSGSISNERGLEIANEIQQQGATAELSDLAELVPGYGDLVRFNRAKAAGFAVPETFAFGTGAALNLLLAAGVARGAPVVFKATTGRITAGRVGPLTRVNNVDYATTSGSSAAKIFAEASREIPNTRLAVEASTPGDVAHIARATSLKEQMVQAVLENRGRALARQDTTLPPGSQTRAPSAVEVIIRPDAERVQGAVNLERTFNAPDATLGQGVFTNRVVVVEGPLAAERITQFTQAARSAPWDAVTVRSIAKQGDNAPHLASNRLAQSLRRAGIRVQREGQVVSDITATAEGTRPLTQAPSRVNVVLRPDQGPGRVALPSGRRQLAAGEVVIETDPVSRTAQVVKPTEALVEGSPSQIIERLNPTLRQDLTQRLGQTRAVEILDRLGVSGDRPATSVFVDSPAATVPEVVESINRAASDPLAPTGAGEGLTSGERQSLTALFERSKQLTQTRFPTETTTAERVTQLRDLTARSIPEPPPADATLATQAERAVARPAAAVQERQVTLQEQQRLARLQEVLDTSSIGVTEGVASAPRVAAVGAILTNTTPFLVSTDPTQRAAAQTLTQLLPNVATQTVTPAQEQQVRQAASTILPIADQQSVNLILAESARQPAAAPFQQPAPAASPTPFPQESPQPQPAPAPQPFQQPAPVPFPEPETSTGRTTTTAGGFGVGGPTSPPRPPRRSRGGEPDELDREPGAGVNLRSAGINRGFLDTTVDFATGEVNTVTDLDNVPEGPTRNSFTPLTFSEQPTSLQRIPWGANDLIVGPGGRFKWIKANGAMPPESELQPASEFKNGGDGAPKTTRKQGTNIKTRSVSRRRGRSL